MYTYFHCLLLLTKFLILTFNVGYMQLEIFELFLSLLITYDWLLKFHISNKSNKQFLFNIRVRNVLKQEESNCKKRKCHVNLDSITFQWKSHESSIKKSTFHLTWNYLKLSNLNFHYYKIKYPHLNSESLSELENSETEASLKQFL